MCFDADNIARMFDTSVPVARHGHWCCECGSIIHPGENYERATGLWEGGWNSYATCGACCGLRARVIAHETSEGCDGPEACPPFGELLACAADLGWTVLEDGDNDGGDDAAG